MVLKLRFFKVIQVIIPVIYFHGCNQKTPGEYIFTNPYTIEITGNDFQWNARYPGKDGELNSKDDICVAGDIHLPAYSTIKIVLKSNDYLYFVYLPELETTGMAVPGMEHELQFNTYAPIILQFKGNQMCGYSHESLIKKLFIQQENQFKSWSENQTCNEEKST